MRSRALKTIFVFPAALAVQDTPAGLMMVRSGALSPFQVGIDGALRSKQFGRLVSVDRRSFPNCRPDS